MVFAQHLPDLFNGRVGIFLVLSGEVAVRRAPFATVKSIDGHFLFSLRTVGGLKRSASKVSRSYRAPDTVNIGRNFSRRLKIESIDIKPIRPPGNLMIRKIVIGLQNYLSRGYLVPEDSSRRDL